MDIILRFVIISWIIALFLGWLINLLILFLLKIFRPNMFRGFPGIKRQIVYAFPTGFIVWIIGLLVFLAGVEMH